MCDPGLLPGLFYAPAAPPSVIFPEVRNRVLLPQTIGKSGSYSRIQALCSPTGSISSLVRHNALDKLAGVQYEE